MLTPHSIKRFAGLYSSSNPTRPPEGATEIDQETVRRSLDVAEPRRGYKASTAAGGPINAIGFKQSQVVAITYDTPGNTGALRLYNPVTNVWSALPMNPGGLPLDHPAVGAITDTRFVSAQKALYFQSRYGLTKVEDIATGVSRAALQPRNWTRPGVFGIGTLVITAAGAGTWLANNFQAAYRITICRKGANMEVIESEPSERIIVLNTDGAPRGTLISVMVSYMVPPDAFIRIYRSKTVAAATDPSDELFLIAETLPINVLLDANGYIDRSSAGASYIDLTPDTSLYVPLYTNPQSGLGIAQANTPAQLSADIAWFKARLYSLNTIDIQRLTVKILGTGTGGLQDGDSCLVNGIRFTFRTAPGTSVRDVRLSTAGTVAQNIENTARALIVGINSYFDGNTVNPGGGDTGPLFAKVFASYLSSTSIDAGQVLLQSIVPGAVAFSFATSSVNGWDKDYRLGATSDPNAQVSGLAWSAAGQPEGNPTANNTPIGDPTADGQRLIALRETLFAFKKDGLWRITDDGSTLGPSVQLVDPTIRLLAPETACALDNMIFALCDQGAVLITETGGVVNISHQQIERELFKLIASVGNAKLAELAFGVAYQPEHTYILALPESPTATCCTRQYVYNLQSQAWDSWAIPGGVLCGAAHPDTGQLYWGRPDGTLAIERKDYAASDYQDPGFTIASPTTLATKTLVFAGDLRTGATPIAVGDLVQQFQAVNALSQRVVAVAYSSAANQTTVTLDAVPRYGWNQLVPLTIVKAIQAQLKFLPFHAGEPLTDKTWGDCYLAYRYCDLDFIGVGWASEKYPLTAAANPVLERVNDADGGAGPVLLDQWGAKPFGAAPWGRQARDVMLKATMPPDFRSSSELTLALTMPCALNRFELSAIDLKITGGSDRVVR